MGDLTASEPHRHTMDRLEAVKHQTASGADYWKAREILPILGYDTWRNFQAAIERARAACAANGLDPSQHFAETSKMVVLASDARREVTDYFLSRGACYLIAMNGDPSKPEIAAAQAYFAAQTRRMELEDRRQKEEALGADTKRLDLRDKVTRSVRRVSSAAKDAGVSSKRQGIFHEQRYVGLYNASSAQVKRAKRLPDGENIFDRFGPLELSAHDFQMNLAADVLANENVRGEQAAFKRNLEVAQQVRKTIRESGGTPLEQLPLEEPIKDVRKRVTGKQTKALPRPRNPTA